MAEIIVNRFRTSFAQQRLWFLDQYEPGTGLYNIPAAWRVCGELDREALEQSLNEIIRRHEVLRTTFAGEGEEPVQVVAECLHLSLEIRDLSGEANAEQYAQQLVQEEAQRPFDLSEGPLICSGLLKVAERDHIFLLTLHHVISDGWSMGVLMQELSTLYRTFGTHQPSPLIELPIQYADYAVWQREWLQGDVLQEQLSYWTRVLEGAPPVLELPTDRPRPAVLTHHGASVEFDLGTELSVQLRKLSQQTQTTLFMALAAVFNVLLHRYSRQDDICIGYPVANRNRTETEGLIGFFVNTLVLRTKVNPNQSVGALLKQVREAVLDADAHQDLPFEKLVEELKPERSTNYSPLFQVMFAFYNAGLEQGGGSLSLPGLQTDIIPSQSHTAKFDLSVDMMARDGNLFGAIEYNTDLFDRQTIERMVGHYRVLLEAVVADPMVKLKDLPLLTQAERHQILVEWNDTKADFPQDKCIHQLFEDQVQRSPDAVAVVFEDQQLTYGELNTRSNQLAHYLRELGVKPDALVAICVERSLEMVVGLLGILKAGGAYVPLDPEYPQERLAYMLADTAASVLLTQGRLKEQLPENTARMVCLDTDWISIGQHPELNPTAVTLSQHLAYCIYTSGSTGSPKGVMVEHQSLVNLIVWHVRTFTLSCGQRSSSTAGIAFDATAWEIWSPLSACATLVLPTVLNGRNPEQLLQWWEREVLDLSFLVTPLAEFALDRQTKPSRLNYLLIGGDRLHRLPPRELKFALINNYGPTETTVVATSGRIESCTSVLHIGRPITNTNVYILDSYKHPVQIGVAGEIHIAGVGLARGYLNRSDLTAEKFLPNPFGEPGSRMYRTGDLGRYLPDGNIEFLGRIDHQVKIRGFRIELGEIETALHSHEAIREAVVTTREDSPGDKRLVAYVVPQTPNSLTIEALREHLQKSLPEYMVPSGWVFLEALPLNANGKLARKALPAPDATRADLSIEYVAPRTEMEQILAGIWAEVLKVERVGIHDNFFALGGHSLLATQVVARIREAMRTEVPLRGLFQAPTVSQLGEYMAQVLGQATASPAITRMDRRESLLSSFAQQRLWFLDQYESGTGLYNIPAAWRIEGLLDRGALQQCLNEVIRRHEVLRTTFASEGDEPVQIIAAELQLTLDVIDLPQQGDVQQLAQRLVQEEAERSFDLAQGPLIRAGLIKLGEGEHILLLTLHHVIADGWSMGVLMQELGTLYRAFSAGEASPLGELPIQYADYAVWQRQWLQGEVLQEQFGYWKHTLEGAPPVLELPTDRLRPTTLTHCGSAVEFDLGVELSAKVRQLSQRSQVTLFMTLAAVFNVLLHRYSRQDDICIGYPVANRNRVETEGLIGIFVNTLVLRTQLNSNQSVLALLKQVRDAVLDADAHQDLPFEKLVEELKPERSINHSPLFQVMLTLNNTEATGLELAGLQLQPMQGQSSTAKFDLTLGLAEHQGRLLGSFEYNTDLFDRTTIERMVGHFRILLEAVTANPQTKLRDLPLLTQAERHQLLVEWNDTKANFPHAKCIHQLFEEQVQRTPDAVAVIFEDQQLTYGELNTRSNQLAHYLRELGVKPDALVAICVERSLEMVVGLLGILKAGGAYVPLDPEYPQERLAYMLADTAASVLLTQGRLKEQLPENTARMVCLDTDWISIGQHPELNPTAVTLSQHLAYCIYTSGSTGSPKGVMVEHQSLVNLIVWHVRTFTLSCGQRSSSTAGIAFDATAWEIWSPLSACATLVLPTVLNGRNPEQLLQWWEREVLDLSFLVTPLAEFALDRQTKPSRLNYLLIGGDRLHRLPPRELKFALINNYGPTETTVVATSGRIESCTSVLHIGRPITNTNVYILDSYKHPVQIGVAGEIHIAGVGLARGYLNRSDLTAEKFLPNPFGEPGSRMYRTGDLGRYLPDGNIEFLGRIDHQVKIRGFRIELGEIETALHSHEAIREAVVTTREDSPGDKRLVAYVVPQTPNSLTIEALREHLQKSLPEYMVPSGWVFLEALPLNANGKLARKALPAPDATRADLSIEYVAPRTEMEQILAGIWAEVLKVERVGIHDNFFALGGHSLLATQVVARIREAMRTEVPLRGLFQAPTVSQLGEYMAQVLGQATASPAITRMDRRESLLSSFAQQRLWFLDQYESGTGLYNIPAAWRIEGLLDRGALQQCLNEVIRRHEVLRTTFASEGDEPVQIIAAELQLTLDVIDLPQQGDVQQLAQRLVQEEAERSFDLAQGPLIRAGLIKLGEGEHILLLTLHHVIADGWSMGVLMQELGTLYRAFSAGEASPLGELPIQYADYAVWQRQWLQGEVLQEQFGYWKHTLEGAPPVLELPTDRLRPTTLTHCGSAVEFDLGVELSAKVRQLSQRSQVTLFMTLAAVFNVLLHRYSRQDDICIGYPVANRNRVETEGLIGIFVNTLVLRTQLNSNQSVLALLKQVRDAVLDADAHQDLPFEKLVEELKPERSINHSPLFQVMLTLNNTEATGLELAGLQLQPMQGQSSTAKFDLTLGLAEHQGRLLGSFEYNTDLFDRTTIERMVGHFRILLEAVTANPQTKLRDLPLLTQAERHQLLVEWNDTKANFPHAKCIHQLFEDQVQRSPDAVAVVFEDQQLTYGELNTRSNQLAHYLRELGVKPDALVAICVERSLEMVVGLLGILKAGGAYVPLDPEYPQERLAYMLQDTAATVLLTQEQLKDKLPQHAANIVCLDSDWARMAKHPVSNPAIVTLPQHLAYCIYTSGSTGKPKGVMVAHSSIHNLIQDWCAHEPTLPTERFSLWTSVGFDVSAWEWMLPLARGASLAVPNEGDRLDPQRFLTWADMQGVTTAYVPPHIARMLPRLVAQGIPMPPRLLLGVEPLDEGGLYESLISCRVVNGYGPTEATVYATSYRDALQSIRRNLPIGRPISNTQIYILDAELNLVPVGAAGEIYIAGVGLARGYLNRPDLTAEKFLPNPFGEPGSRMYRTGDLGRYLPDGNIEFLGRIDHQVKIRGFRIELGEIETALHSHEAIREAVVTTREDSPGDKRLVAYVVPQTPNSLTIEALREHLQKSLPEHMVPSSWVFLESLPLNANGKIDRKALPAPDATRADLGVEYVAPRTEMEQILAGIWAEVLKVERVGIHDNFFALGGHSLRFAMLQSQIFRRTACNISMRELFMRPTPAKQAVFMEQIKPDKHREHQLENCRQNNNLTSPRVAEAVRFAQSQVNGKPWKCQIAFYINSTVENLTKAIGQIWSMHDALQSNFICEGEICYQTIGQQNSPYIVPLQAQEKNVVDMEIMYLAHRLGTKNLNLTSDPLIRFDLLPISKSMSIAVLITVEHLIFDTISEAVLLTELMQAISGQEISKSKMAKPFSSYGLEQYTRVQNSKEGGITFFTEMYAEKRPHFLLPYRNSAQLLSKEQYRYFNVVINAKESTLQNYASQHSCSIAVIALTALQYYISMRCGQEVVDIETNLSGRTDVEYTETIGLFMNSIVLRLIKKKEETFTDLLYKNTLLWLDVISYTSLPHFRLKNMANGAVTNVPQWPLLFEIDPMLGHSLDNERSSIMQKIILPARSASRDVHIILGKSNSEKLMLYAQYNPVAFTEQGIGKFLEEFAATITAEINDHASFLNS